MTEFVDAKLQNNMGSAVVGFVASNLPCSTMRITHHATTDAYTQGKYKTLSTLQYYMHWNSCISYSRPVPRVGKVRLLAPLIDVALSWPA